MYQYTIKRLEAGSSKYGCCEVCGSHADTMYYQTESTEYETLKEGVLVVRLTRSGCTDLFGHKQCLEGGRFPNRLEK